MKNYGRAFLAVATSLVGGALIGAMAWMILGLYGAGFLGPLIGVSIFFLACYMGFQEAKSKVTGKPVELPWEKKTEPHPGPDDT